MLKSPLIMGVLNMTPDSFSGDGLHRGIDAAVAQGERMVKEGAALLDVGGESTRPGAAAVSVQEELDRVVPVLEKLKGRVPATLSVDTRKFEVAEAAVRAGATIVNDISGGADHRLAKLPATFILMHMQGQPQTMQDDPKYPRGVVVEVREYLESRVRAFTEAGVSWERLWVDPGIGFGKTLSHNLEILRDLALFVGVGQRLVIGTSRKSFLGGVLSERHEGTIASNLWAWEQGASVLRVHDVGALSRALKTWEAIHAGQ